MFNSRQHPKMTLTLSALLILLGCTTGPDYVKPAVNVPAQYKETNKNWKIAQPQNVNFHIAWWDVFNDPQLTELETRLNNANQTIAAAEAQYRQARALVDEARASYFPTLTASAALARQGQGSSSKANTTELNTFNIATGKSTTTNHSLVLDSSWEPDLWGNIRRSVEANQAGAQASAAQLAATRLSTQAALAQYYFELCNLDRDQKLLNDTVANYQKSLKLTQNQYASGVAARADIVQAQSQLESAQTQAINNGISRAQYEHAIAVLIGVPPASFTLVITPMHNKPPTIPVQIPSLLLERRPDIAEAERQMAQANAQIGIAQAAYFPNLTLSATGSVQGTDYTHWFSLPALSWAVGPTLAGTLFDGGLRSATTAAARANYDASVANYRQTVLAAFQDVEDNLAALRILNSEAIIQDQAAANARLALQLITNQYKAGTVAYTNVITAQINAYNAEKSAADITGLRMTTTVALVKALGGGWEASLLDKS